MERTDALADASGLIYLAEADALGEARAIVGVMGVAPAVWSEVMAAGRRKGPRDVEIVRRALDDGLLRPIELDPADERAALSLAERYRLGRGESQVLVCGRKDDRIVMDDVRAARVARGLGFVPVATATLPVLGVRRQVLGVNEALRLLRRLASVIGIRADVLIQLEAAIQEEQQ